jgi:hypothetical protein
MDFWDEIESDDLLESSSQHQSQMVSNRYLDDPDEALILISKLLEFKQDVPELKKMVRRLDYFIHDDFRRFASSINIQEDIAVYQKMLQIKEKIKEINRISLFSSKNFLAIGGGFSAGKSKFINSIIGMELLPEDQTPSTSIPTYIIREEEKLSAYTFRNQELEIDEEAMKALSHAFYDKYKLSFSKIIKNINVQTPNFPYENLILLDTPGYTKAESFKQESNTDEFMAREQLRVADFIIWLMDIDNGIMKEEDLNFLGKIGKSIPILFVFNKADIKPDSQIEEIVKKSKEVIAKRGFNTFGVTAYSSLEIREYSGDYINQFFHLANQPLREEANLIREFEDSLEVYEQYFKDSAKLLLKQKNDIGQILNEANHFSQIVDLVSIYSDVQSGIRNQYKLTKDLQALKKKFSQIIEDMDSYTYRG